MKTLIGLAAITLVLSGCGALGSLGDLDDILGSTGADDRADIRGQVVRVATADQRIDLDVSYVNNLRDERRGSSIYWDANTEVIWEGRQYAPTDLEPGDEISATGSNRNGRWIAGRIQVLRNVRGS